MITQFQDIQPGVKLIHFSSDRIDFHIGLNLKKELEDIIEKHDQVLIFDFSNVTFMDSTGLGVFVYFLQKFSKNETEMIFISLSPGLMELMNLSKIDNFVTLYNNLDLAKQALHIS